MVSYGPSGTGTGTGTFTARPAIQGHALAQGRSELGEGELVGDALGEVGQAKLRSSKGEQTLQAFGLYLFASGSADTGGEGELGRIGSRRFFERSQCGDL